FPYAYGLARERDAPLGIVGVEIVARGIGDGNAERTVLDGYGNRCRDNLRNTIADAHIGARRTEIAVDDRVRMVAAEVTRRRKTNAHDVRCGGGDRDDALGAAVDQAVVDAAWRRHVAKGSPLRSGRPGGNEKQQRYRNRANRRPSSSLAHSPPL